MDFPDYNFDGLGLLPDDSKSFLDEGILLPIFWIDDDDNFLCL